MFTKTVNYRLLLFVLLLLGLAAGCDSLSSKEETGVVIARRAQVRSSTAVVAADLLEVERGNIVEILDSDTAENGEKWLLVRANDQQKTEGWIEARNIMPREMLERSKKLAEEDEDIQRQATGQLRASTNLRITPDRTINDNIMMKLDRGDHFDIIGWQLVPKPKSSETTESDDAPKAGSASTNSRGQRDRQEEPKMPEEANELWYKVRLSPSISPAPAGWVYGKQVELTVPSDIIFYRTGREFVAWRRLDEADDDHTTSASKGTDDVQEAKPGSWVILEKSSSNEGRKIGEPDFDRIYVLGYDKESEEHYTAYRSPDLKGRLPLRLEGKGDTKFFIVNVVDDDGSTKEARYRVYKDNKGLLRVEPPPSEQRGRKRR